MQQSGTTNDCDTAWPAFRPERFVANLGGKSDCLQMHRRTPQSCVAAHGVDRTSVKIRGGAAIELHHRPNAEPNRVPKLTTLVSWVLGSV